MWLVGSELIPQKHLNYKIENAFSAQTLKIHPFLGKKCVYVRRAMEFGWKHYPKKPPIFCKNNN